MSGIRKTKTIISLLGLLVTLPLQLALSFLLYQHVKAPSIIWILWIIQMPMIIIIQIISAIATKEDK